MSDSVDRVFVHALNTVKKLPRTGSARPPPADRLQLYGLYKQSMEGDVDAVMDRPVDDGDQLEAARNKWDAWNEQKGLSKTEAKRRYISTLIETMHRYASTTPDARELVSELEFVWDQIKSNVPSSSSSSPLQVSGLQVQQTSSYPSLPSNTSLRIVRPTSQNDGDEAEEDQYDIARNGQDHDSDRDYTERRSGAERQRRDNADAQGGAHVRKWRRKMEQALVRMTAEIAAMREQLELKRVYGDRRRRSLWAWVLWMVLCTMKHVLIDAVLLSIALLWMRRKEDKRLEQILLMAFGIVREKARRLKIPRR